MKKFTLPQREAQILMEVLNGAPTNGITVGQMRIALKLAAIVEPAAASKEGGEVMLEDADYSHLRARLESQMWVVVSPKILSLVDLVEGATS